MNKYLQIAGAFFGLTAVLIGAFGAHGLEAYLDEKALQTLETGVKYQMYHALLLLLLPQCKVSAAFAKAQLFLITLGILCFSGSIYGLATNVLTSFDFKQIALVTPLGGTLLISAWAALLFQFIKRKQ